MADDPLQRLFRNAVLLQRLSNGLTGKSNALIGALMREIAGALAKIDPTAVARASARSLRADRLLAEVRTLAKQHFDDWHKVMRSDLAEIGAHHAVRVGTDLAATIGAAGVERVLRPGPTVNMLKAIIDSDPFGDPATGLDTLRGWAQGQSALTVQRVHRQIQLGLANEETLPQLIERIRGSALPGGGRVGGVAALSERDAEAVARTSVTYVANRAAHDTYANNPKVTQQYQYVATLDDRTTFICMSLDGRLFNYDDTTAPRPPQHLRCRSIIVPVVDWEGLGVEPPSDPGTRAARDPRTGRSVQVDSRLDWGKWLKRQPDSYQNRVLGPERAKLFRAGKLTMKDLIGGDGRPLTVEQLKARADRRAKDRARRAAAAGKKRQTVRVNEERRWSTTETDALHRKLAEGLNVRRGSGDMMIVPVEDREGVKDILVRGTVARMRANGVTDADFENFHNARRGVRSGTGTDYTVVDSLVHDWAASSDSTNKYSNAIQQAARELYAPNSTIDHFLDTFGPDWEEGRALLASRHGGVVRAFVRAQYEVTQEYLAGTQHVTMFRGMSNVKFASGPADAQTLFGGIVRIGKVQLQPASSFSTSVTTAFNFGESVVVYRVPKARFLTTSRTGLGCIAEAEAVVAGGEVDGLVFDQFLALDKLDRWKRRGGVRGVDQNFDEFLDTIGWSNLQLRRLLGSHDDETVMARMLRALVDVLGKRGGA